MNKKTTTMTSCILLAAVAVAMSSAAFAETSKTQRLKQMLDALSHGHAPVGSHDVTRKNGLMPTPGTIGTWADIHRTSLDDNRGETAKEVDIDSYAAGVDYQLTERTIVGVALFRQKAETVSDAWHPYAGVSIYSTIDSDTDGIGVYVRHFLGSGLLLDGSFTYTDTETTITDYDTLSTPSSESTDGHSYGFDVGASGILPITVRSWVSGRVSFNYTRGEQDGYDDGFGVYESQDYEVGTAAIDVNLNYAFVPGWRLYGGGNFGYDLISDVASPAGIQFGGLLRPISQQQKQRDRTSYGFQFGLNASFTPDLTLSAGYRQQNWGIEMRAQTWGANLRYTF